MRPPTSEAQIRSRWAAGRGALQNKRLTTLKPPLLGASRLFYNRPRRLPTRGWVAARLCVEFGGLAVPCEGQRVGCNQQPAAWAGFHPIS